MYHRAGISHLWPVPKPLLAIGFNGVGIIEEVGESAKYFIVGYRVAYGMSPLGSYSGILNYPSDKLLHLSSNMEDKKNVQLLIKGMTVHYLLNRTHKVLPTDIILVYTAAGGMGLILCQ